MESISNGVGVYFINEEEFDSEDSFIDRRDIRDKRVRDIRDFRGGSRGVNGSSFRAVGNGRGEGVNMEYGSELSLRFFTFTDRVRDVKGFREGVDAVVDTS